MTSILETETKSDRNYKLGIILSWSLLGLVYVLIIIMTFMKTPEEITNTLTTISSQLKYYFLAVHIVILLLLGTGFIWKKFRTQSFFTILILLAISSTVVSSIYVVIPNIIFFGTISVIILISYLTKKLEFDFKNVNIMDWIMSCLGLLFGFWYLHWVEDPIALNALLYSPLGGVNCPTLVMLSALLILSKKPKPIMMTTFVGALTIYFGFFGMIMLGAYVDIALILCGMYLVGKSWFEKIK